MEQDKKRRVIEVLDAYVRKEGIGQVSFYNEKGALREKVGRQIKVNHKNSYIPHLAICSRPVLTLGSVSTGF